MYHFGFSYPSGSGTGGRRRRPRSPATVSSRATIRPLLVALLSVLSVTPLAGQLHLAAGLASIHDGHRGPAVEVGLRTPLDARERVTAGGVVLAGTGGDGFATAAASVEIGLDPDALFAPFLGLRAGVLAEPGGNRAMAGAVIGLAPRIGPGRRLRLAAGWSRHGGDAGPRVLLLGLELGRP